MLTNKNISFFSGLFLLFTAFNLNAQNVSVLKVDNLLKRVHNDSDTLYVVNFWATWCKPCVAELPDFEKIHQDYKSQKVKVILVSMDFKEDLNSKLKPFIKKNNYTAEVVLLDELNGNEFIDKISKQWGGAIPATLITKQNKSVNDFFEKKLHYDFLVDQISKHK